MKLLNQINLYTLLISTFFLPINLNINNIFLFIFIGINIFIFLKDPKKKYISRLKANKKLIILVSLPFWLNAFGLLYSDEFYKGLDFLIRMLPFLFVPVVAVINPIIFKENCLKIGYSLVLGCLFVVLWSWGFSISYIIKEGGSLKDLFGPLHSHHNLLKNLDMHAAYLSMFIYTSIGFLAIEMTNSAKKKTTFICILIGVLIAFLFHLLSRTAIFYFLFSTCIYLVYFKRWKVIVGLVLLIFVLSYSAYNTPHNYLRDRLFNNLNFFEKKTQFSKKDDRFDRLSASYEIFKKRPILGYGTAAESKYRKQIFKINNDQIAYENNYNAHNQFFEYLSTFGLVGAVIFLLFFGNLFLIIIKLKDFYFLFILTGLFLACITESIFERSWGVVYTSLVIGLMISLNKETIIKGINRD